MKPSLLPFLLPVIVATAVSLPAAENPADAFAGGKLALNARLRSENVQQTGLRNAEALTLRTRLGFSPAPFHGWTALVEAENIVALDGDAYSQAGINPGGTGRAVVADPELTALSQAWLAFKKGGTTGTAGRQRLVLDQARFVGDVGWRQHMQTFDAVVVQDKSFPNVEATYAYLDRINRVFGDDHPQGHWESDSHVVNANYRGFPAGTLAAYAYLLDFKNSPANSSATYGASFSGQRTLNHDLKLAGRAELATQSDYGAATSGYRATYAALEAGLVFPSAAIHLGFEQLGSDRNVGFKTPLATLHAFNGWADLFLNTPAAGLRDTYAKVTASLPGKIALIAFLHEFDSEATSAKLGREFDAQLSRKFQKSLTALVKFASFRSRHPAYPDVQKIWVQIEFSH